ncbi:MAG: Rpn family recombination-promoting nuclease/putative transposase [Bacilli bacterium]|nr:Rpn family recombination-promoting nuclease/putative transposase [Bacilli bacterium]
MNTVIEKKELIPLTFDVMFTEIFNDVDNICILEEFIAGYFKYSLEDVRGNLEILSRKLGKENKYDSRKEVDLLLNLNGKKINIEMSNNNSMGVVNRNIVYLCKIHGNQLKEGDNSYSKINESIQIVFNNFNCQDELRNTYYLRDDSGNTLSKKFRIDIINLAKGKDLCYNVGGEDNYLINWCKILTENKVDNFKDISHQILTKETTDKLINKISKLSGDDGMVRLYTKLSRREMEFNTLKEEAQEAGFKEGFNNGFNDGFNDGIEQNNIEITKKMLKENIDIELISKITGLSKEEIGKI